MGTCKRPPKGWTCRREAGHEGPCAAEKTPSIEDMPVGINMPTSRRIVDLVTQLALAVQEELGTKNGRTALYVHLCSVIIQHLKPPAPECERCGGTKQIPYPLPWTPYYEELSPCPVCQKEK